jgi:hypothetical protein
MDIALPCWIDFEGSQHRMFGARVSLVWWTVWSKQDHWSGRARGLVCKLVSVHRASCNWALWSLTFQLTTRLSKLVKYLSYFTWHFLFHSTSALALAYQPLHQQGRATQHCAPPTVLWVKLSGSPCPSSGSLALHFVPSMQGIQRCLMIYILCLWHSVLYRGREELGVEGCNLPTSCARLCSTLKCIWSVALTCWCCTFTPIESWVWLVQCR